MKYSLWPETISQKYEIEKILSQSKFATVYLANQRLLNRKVIIKILSPQIAREESAVKRFEREAKILSELDDPGVTKIYDFGQEDGGTFIVSEYVPGATLEEVLSKKKRLPVEEVLKIGKEIALILSRIHQKGILHRDIKPSNIILKEDGQVKLTDFGLAQSLRIEKLTLEGEIIGTPAYMSPEQISGKEFDFRSDIFSLGVVLFELLTGENPFVSPTFTGVLNKILNHKLNLKVLPQELWGLFSRMLAKDPNKRFSSCEELIREINLLLGEEKPSGLSSHILHFLWPRFLFVFLILTTFLIGLHLFFISRRKASLEKHTPLEVQPIIPDKRKETVEGEQKTPPEKYEIPDERASSTSRSQPSVTHSFTKSGFVAVDSGYLRVQVEPWADVYFNGEYLGTTPFGFPFKLPAGEVKLKFSHPEFGVIEKVFAVLPKETTNIFFDFKSSLGGLKVLAEPWARIYLDGEEKGEVPIGIIYALPGRHELKLLNPNFPPYSETLELRAGEIVERVIKW